MSWGFFKRGRSVACLNQSGIQPELREEFIKSRIVKPLVFKRGFQKAEGKASDNELEAKIVNSLKHVIKGDRNEMIQNT